MDTTKAIEIFEKSSHVGVLFSQNPTHDALASADVLAHTLREKGKHVGLLNAPESAALTARPYRNLSASAPMPREFIISLDTTQSPVSQMRYEKESGRIDVVFSPREGEIQKEQVSFRTGSVLCNCIVAVGVPDIEDTQSLQFGPDTLQNTPVVNIDHTTRNKQYGEVNLVDLERSSLAEIIYELVVAYREAPLSKENATTLLSALVSATGNFSSPAVSAETLLTASELMRSGAALSDAKQVPLEVRPTELLQLLGRAAVRTKLEKGGEVLWSFLTREDFEKTARSPEDLPHVMHHLEKEFPPHRIAALIWQNPNDGGVRAYLGGNRDLIHRLQSQEVGKLQSPYLLVNASFENFKQAEEILTSLFGDVL